MYNMITELQGEPVTEKYANQYFHNCLRKRGITKYSEIRVELTTVTISQADRA